VLSEKMSTKGMTDGVSSERCLPDRDSAFLEIILEFRDADDFEVEDRSRKQDRGACLDGVAPKSPPPPLYKGGIPQSTKEPLQKSFLPPFKKGDGGGFSYTASMVEGGLVVTL
jgi:hypothetical protein